MKGEGDVPTNKDLDVSLFGESDFEEILCYIAASSSPFLGRFIEDVEYSEPLREIILQVFEFAFKKDIVLGDLQPVNFIPETGLFTLP